jgi:hypothetical protein
MTKVTSANRTGDLPVERSGRETKKTSSQPSSSAGPTRDANLQSLSRRSAVSAEPNPEGARRRRARLPQTGGAAPAEERPQPDQAAPNAAGGNWMRHLWKAYVGALAVGAGYGVYQGSRQASSGPESPPGTSANRPPAAAPKVPSPRIDLPTVYQARENVLQRFGTHIPADSDCHSIEPQLDQLPFGMPGVTDLQYVPELLGNAKVVGMHLDKTLPRELATHITQHEYIHCYNSPEFQELLLRSGTPSISEGLAQHFTEKFPDGTRYRGTVLDNGSAAARLANGKSGVELAAELELTVGKDTLERAYFGGEPEAIAKVADAIYGLWPKAPTPNAWLHTSRWRGAGQQAMAESFVGATLLHTGSLPSEELGQSYPIRFALPVGSFAEISAEQAAALRAQASKVRKALGPNAFDRAFCATNPAKQQKAMNKLADELQRLWRPVLG